MNYLFPYKSSDFRTMLLVNHRFQNQVAKFLELIKCSESLANQFTKLRLLASLSYVEDTILFKAWD